MSEYSIEAEAREITGKGNMRKMRTKGILPGVVYGHTQKTIHLTLETKEFMHMLYKGLSLNDPMTLSVKADKDSFSKTVFIKELQRDPVTNEVLHVDFYTVEPTQKITLPIIIKGKGTPMGKEQGGILQQLTSEIKAEGLVPDLPREIEVDLSQLNVGDSLSVGQLTLPANIRVLDSEDKVLFHVLSAKKVYIE
ncbi:50S ribosomal protein L25 [bacterium]|nr:50S ribosomal protein L25 [bacterium]